MKDIILTVLASVTASGGMTAAVIWLSKTWLTERLKNAIKYEYDQKFEVFKAAVQSEHNVALERLRSDLRTASFERETRFAKLHERRAVVIAEMHAHLQDLIVKITNYLEHNDDSPSLHEVKAQLEKCSEHYRHNKIYLPDEIERQYDIFTGKLLHNLYIPDQNIDIEKELKPLFHNLKVEFKRLLGDESV